MTFFLENRFGHKTYFDVRKTDLKTLCICTQLNGDLSLFYEDRGDRLVMNHCLPYFMEHFGMRDFFMPIFFLRDIFDLYPVLPKYFVQKCPICYYKFKLRRIGKGVEIVDEDGMIKLLEPPFNFECPREWCGRLLQMTSLLQYSTWGFWIHEAHYDETGLRPMVVLAECGDVELNPGPTVLSKLNYISLSDLWERNIVQSQSLGDFFKLPGNIGSIANDFNAFVNNMPNRDFLYSAYSDMSFKINQMLNILNESSTKLLETFAFMKKGLQVFGSLLIGVLLVVILRSLQLNEVICDVITTLGTTFIFQYFHLYDYIRGPLRDHSMLLVDYIKQKFTTMSQARVVPLQSFGNDLTDMISQPENISGLLATLFTIIFVGAVKYNPSTKDYEDLSRKVFNYQRGVTSVAASFDKLKEFWNYVLDVITEKFQLKRDEETVTTYTVYRKVDDWITRNTILFKSGFSHTLTMDEKKKKLETLRSLYNEGLDMTLLCSKLDRTKNVIVTFWNNKLHNKITEMSTEALEGSMRNAPTTILLYGSSGAGKSSLVTALASFTSKVHSVLTNTEQPSSASVYVRNCDQAHYDGYTNQFTLVIDDFLSRKDTEANPNLEPNELIKIKNNIPFPLPMAHLPDKGRFLNSEVVIATTNVKNVTRALPSMNFPFAVANRLSDLSYAVRVKPAYRKYIPPTMKQKLISQGLLDQHSVDPMRARYMIDDAKFKQYRKISLDEVDALNTYTDEEFASFRGEERRLPNGDIQYMNYDLYYFQRLDIKDGSLSGPYLSWGEFLDSVEQVYTNRISIGNKILQQSEWTHTTSLAHMKAGIIDVPGYVISQMDRQDFLEAVQNDHFVDAMDEEKRQAVHFGMANYDMMHNPNHEELHQMYITYCQRWEDYEELIKPHEDVMVDIQQNLSIWKQMFNYVKGKYDYIVENVMTDNVVVILSMTATIFGTVWFFKTLEKAIRGDENWRQKPEIRAAVQHCDNVRDNEWPKRSWWDWLFGNNAIHLSYKDIPLTPADIDRIFHTYDYYIVQSQGVPSYNSGSSGNSVRYKKGDKQKHSAFVPSHCFDMEKISELVEVMDLENEMKENGMKVSMKEHEIPAFVVRLEGCQLVDQFLDYVLPANGFMMRVLASKNNKKYDFGNVFFIEDRKFLMPNHYMLMLKYQMRRGNIDGNDMVTFLRGPTTLERRKQMNPNKIQCMVSDIMDYAQITSPAHVDDPTPFSKDAIVVNVMNMSGHSCSNMINKFITRAEYTKLNAPGFSGYLITQRFVDDGTDSCYCNPLPCVDITPVNKYKYVSRGGLSREDNDLIGLASAGPVDNPVYFQSLIRDRYNYKADTRQGDCGAVLFAESRQLQHPLIGIHVSGDKQQGRANSVPITQEDIREAIGRLNCCPSQGFLQPELEGLSPSDVDDVIPNLPTGNYHYIGKLTGKVPIQPLKTVIQPSEAQIHLNVLNDAYKMKKGKSYRLDIKKKPAHLRAVFENPEGCRIYYAKKKGLMYESGELTAPLTQGLFNVWLAKGGKLHDVLMKGLEKTSVDLPYIEPRKIDRAIRAVKQKFFRRGPNGTCPYEKAVSQNLDVLTPIQIEEINEFANRRKRLVDLIENAKHKQPREIYESILRTMTLTKQEHMVFKDSIDLDVEIFRDEILFQLNALTVESTQKLYFETMPNPMLLTIEQAVMGIPGDPTICSINSKKSPGYPYSCRGLNFGKKPWVGKECKCDGELWPELEKDVLDLEEKCKQGIPPIYFVATLKDELRPIEKVDSYKTRVFCAGPMHFTILFRRYFMRFLSHVMENKLFNESALGINPYSLDWERLADYLNYWDGPFCVAGDYSNFDGTLSNQIMEKILDIILDFYARYGATEEEQTIRRHLWYCLTRSMVIGRNGCVFRLFNSQPSGNPFTTIINILFNSIVFRMAYADIMMECPDLKRDIFDFENDVHFMSYGDDNIANINPDIIHVFNMKTISAAMAKYGLTYTDETKNDVLLPAKRLEEVGFLKRGFRKVNEAGRRWVAPLDIDTVKEMVMWVRRSDEDMKKQILSDVLEISLREMVLHGVKEYDDWSMFIQGFEDSKLLGKDMITIPDYETQFVRTCNEDLDPDPSF